MKRKNLFKSFSVLISVILFISIMPFYILMAEESPTYIPMTINVPINVGKVGVFNTFFNLASGDDVRFVCVHNSNDRYYFFAVSKTTFTLQKNQTNTLNPSFSGSMSISTYSYNGTTYYYSGENYGSNMSVNSDIPIVPKSKSPEVVNAIDYTFGENAIDPIPPEPEIEYGDLKIGFTSSIAYSGGNSNAWRNNKDTIYFDRYDTLGNDLKGLNIELQAIPYTTEASSKQTLLGQKADEFIYDTVRVGSLGFYSPGQNPIDFTWEYITNRFSPTWFATYGDNWSLTGWYLSDHWYKVGWAYRARVVDDEMNTIIDWQTIYNGTSIDAQDTDNIINNNGYNPDLVNSINEINNFNNTTNNNYYNNQVINYNDGTLTSDGSWIEEFIRGIFETLGNIINAISGIGSSIINGIFDLISNLGVNILGTFTDLWNRFINLFNSIDFTDDNSDFDLDLGLQEGDSPLDIVPAFVRMINSSGLGYVLWLPLVVGIIFMVL